MLPGVVFDNKRSAVPAIEAVPFGRA